MRSLFLLMTILSITSTSLAKKLVRISTGEWSPYISESLEEKGLFSQITREAFAHKGYDIQIGFFPWARATELSKSGEWDGTIAFARIQQREPFYYFSDALYIGRYAFFHLKSRPVVWNTYEDLRNIVMASTRGFGGMGDEFLKAEHDGVIKVLRLTSDVQSFNMLQANRVQAVPSDLEVGYVLLHKIYGKGSIVFTHSTHLIKNSEYHLVISKKAKNGAKLLADFNEGLRHLQTTGRYDQILKEWYSKPIYKEAVPAQYLPAPRIPGPGKSVAHN